MNEVKNPDRGDIRFLLRGLAAWVITAVVLLFAAGLIFSKSNLSSAYMGYCSSAICFLASAAGGAYACRGKREKILVPALITAAAVIILLLSLGYMVSDKNLKADGILSVVSFTISGSLLGSVMSPIIFSDGKHRKNKVKLRKFK